MRVVGPRTIRAKLTLTTMLVMGALLGLLGFLVDFSARTALMGSIDQGLRQEAMNFPLPRRHGPPMGPGELAMGPEERGGPPPGMSRPFPRMGGRSLYRPEFIPVGARRGDGPPPNEPYDPVAFADAARGRPMFSTIRRENEPVRLYSHPVRDRGRVVGVVQVPYPVGEALRSLANLRRTLLTVVIPLGVLLAGAASLFLVGHLMRPLRLITQNAQAIGGSSLASRLPVVGEDEFASLGVTLNGMLDRLEAAFRLEQSTTRRLEETVQQQRRFTADASHELKTPLAVIKANTGLMLHMSGTAEENRESVEAIDEAATRMNRLVQSLLVLARVDAGHLVPRFEPCDLSAVVQDAVRGLPCAPSRVTVRLPSEALTVEGSRDDLARVFVNLIDNALKHGASAEPVEVTLQRQEGKVLATVVDRGNGITPEHLPHLFERFYRPDQSRTSATGGTGLGLAICKGIIEAHRGRIDVRSEPGKGTAFYLALPLQPH